MRHIHFLTSSAALLALGSIVGCSANADSPKQGGTGGQIIIPPPGVQPPVTPG